MKLLFDTHAFIWWDSEPEKLSPKARAACEDPANVLLFSVASAWEMQIKVSLEKLHLKQPLADIIAHQERTNGIQILPVNLEHVFAIGALPARHKDPFDRLLIVQSNVEQISLISHDSVFRDYPVTLFW